MSLSWLIIIRNLTSINEAVKVELGIL